MNLADLSPAFVALVAECNELRARVRSLEQSLHDARDQRKKDQNQLGDARAIIAQLKRALANEKGEARRLGRDVVDLRTANIAKGSNTDEDRNLRRSWSRADDIGVGAKPRNSACRNRR